MATDLRDDFWSWFNVMMKDELVRCREEEQREFITQTWLLTAPVAGSC